MLVCLIGSIRGGPAAWETLKTQVLRPLKADLGILGTQTHPEQAPLFSIARYIWSIPEHVDWGEALDASGREISVWIGGPSKYDIKTLNDSPYIHSLVTMDTYTSTLNSFYGRAEATLEDVDADKAGFGLYNLYAAAEAPASRANHPPEKGLMEEEEEEEEEEGDGFKSLDELDMLAISAYVKSKEAPIISIWASDIPDIWLAGLADFLTDA